MIKIEGNVIKSFKTGIMSLEEFATYLTYNFPAYQMALTIGEILRDEPVKPIAISQEEFDAHFRIKGTRFVEGNMIEETRGRKSKEDKKSFLP